MGAIWNISHSPNRPSFRVICSVYQQTNPSLDDRTSAHRARLQRDVERALVKMPVLQNLPGRPQSQDFSVSSRIAVSLSPILRFGNQFASTVNNCSTHGYFTGITGCLCQFHGPSHPAFVNKISSITNKQRLSLGIHIIPKEEKNLRSIKKVRLELNRVSFLIMDTTTITTEVVELLCRISRQKLREQDITPLVVFLTALISIMRGVMVCDRTIAAPEEERLQKTLKAFASGDRERVELIQRLVKGISKQQVYFNPTELLTLTAWFSESEKLLLIGSGYEMSAADGYIDLREQMYLQSIANRLGLDSRHIAVIDTLFTKEGTLDLEAFAEVKALLDPGQFESREPVFGKAAKHLLGILARK